MKSSRCLLGLVVSVFKVTEREGQCVMVSLLCLEKTDRRLQEAGRPLFSVTLDPPPHGACGIIN